MIYLLIILIKIDGAEAGLKLALNPNFSPHFSPHFSPQYRHRLNLIKSIGFN